MPISLPETQYIWKDGIVGKTRQISMIRTGRSPLTHCSNIPIFHHSNWGEAPMFLGILHFSVYIFLKD